MIVRKGTHSPIRCPRLVWSSEQVFEVTFMPSCRYDIGPEQADINKLFGIGYPPHHHQHSVRFGWRYDKDVDMVEILGYWYDNGARLWESICYTAIGQKWHYAVKKVGDIHELEVNHRTLKVPVRPRAVGYLLRPYFGGNMKAPHDIEIQMKRL